MSVGMYESFEIVSSCLVCKYILRGKGQVRIRRSQKQNVSKKPIPTCITLIGNNPGCTEDRATKFECSVGFWPWLIE